MIDVSPRLANDCLVRTRSFPIRVLGAVAMIFAASVPMAAQAAGTNIADLLKQDEAELVAGAGAGDTGRLQMLAWRIRRFAFASLEPANAASSKIPVACSNAHSNISMLAHVAVSATLTNSGGTNTRTDNDVHRGGLTFFLEPFGEQRARCADALKIDLGPLPATLTAERLVPPFQPVAATAFGKDDKADLLTRIEAMSAVETGLADAVRANDSALLGPLVPVMHAFRRQVLRRDDPGLRRADYAIVKECSWMSAFLLSILSRVHEAVLRPEIRTAELLQAAESLHQYRTAKLDCATALGQPAAGASVHIARDFFGKES